MPTFAKDLFVRGAVDIRRMKRPPTHPGVILAEDFLGPLGISPSDFARRVGISFQGLNDIIHAREAVSVDTAFRLTRVLGVSAQFWMNLQLMWDLWHAAHGEGAKAIARLRPLPKGERHISRNYSRSSSRASRR